MELLILPLSLLFAQVEYYLNSNMELLISSPVFTAPLVEKSFKFQYGATNMLYGAQDDISKALFKFQYGATNILCFKSKN